ncbi:MAG: AAA family ATPase [Mycoplasmataceae bacterium]|nr:AAA family ATPase [Mycoplasmataceae bacterium]
MHFEWKNKKDKKPLIIEGARQIGKTWIIKEKFSKLYKKFILCDFLANEKKLDLIFNEKTNIEEIITSLEVMFGFKIDDDTLIFFDEIQRNKYVISLLKLKQ